MNLIKKLYYKIRYWDFETDGEFEERIKRIQDKDGNHMILIMSMIEERNRIKNLLK